MERVIVGVFMLFLCVLIALDVGMVISLVRPGDERRQMIVWKASTWTLVGTAGSMAICVVEALVRGEAVTANPFTQLGATAILYFFYLLFFRWKHGG